MKLKRATIEDCKTIWQMQQVAFAGLLTKYQDFDTSPGNESVSRIEQKLLHPHTYFYYILVDDITVGAIIVVDAKDGTRKRIAPIFIMQEYRNKGYAQMAMLEAERIHGSNHWQLDTILQEPANCYLYEKLGYHQTGETEIINEKMTIVYYEKD